MRIFCRTGDVEAMHDSTLQQDVTERPPFVYFTVTANHNLAKEIRRFIDKIKPKINLSNILVCFI